jgi:hypothetical protein
MADLGWLTYDQFSERVGETFDVAVGDGRVVPVVLVEATESSEAGGPGPDGEQRRQFSLEFRGSAGQVLPQRTYALTHAELGDLELFLVPIGPDKGPDDGGMRYEAVFA